MVDNFLIRPQRVGTVNANIAKILFLYYNILSLYVKSTPQGLLIKEFEPFLIRRKADISELASSPQLCLDGNPTNFVVESDKKQWSGHF